MTVASQLRLAIGVLIVLLGGILAAALYVPAQLERSANEKYVEDAIPLRSLVHQLNEKTLEMEAAVEAYLLTDDPARLERYYTANADANALLRRMGPYLERHPELAQLRRRATADLGDVLGLFERQIAAPDPDTRRVLRSPVEAALAEVRETSELMLAETERSVDEAEREQRDLYRQLLVVLAALGTLALAIGFVLFALMPRRVGHLYLAEQRSRREAESRAEAARALEHVSDGVILTDARGRVRFWNPGAEHLTGIDEHGALGRELARLLPGWERLARQPDAQSGAGGAAVVPIELGHERWLSVTSVDFGEGVVYAVRDVTEERALETMRSDFVATASHELRTPMTSVSGAARTLLERGSELSEAQRTAFLTMIVSESDRLKRIVEEILLASRLEAGRIEVRHERCDAVEIARWAVEAARVQARGHELRLEVEGPLADVDCDSDRLRQVLGNILDNAIKYSPAGGTVRLELEEDGDMMRFAVHDEGIGFSSAAADRIFDRFRRLEAAQARAIGGTGLGLYICRELVQRMGGRIWAEAEPGRGASFYFELPLAREAAAVRR